MVDLLRRRLQSCVESWPGCDEGLYDPRCCRFPKSCSCTVYDEDSVADDLLEPPTRVPEPVDYGLADVPDEDLADELRRRVLDRRRQATATGAALADAVRSFLAIPIMERAVAAGDRWATDWVAPGLSVGEALALAAALADWESANDEGVGGG